MPSPDPARVADSLVWTWQASRRPGCPADPVSPPPPPTIPAPTAVARILRRAGSLGITAVSLDDADYPHALRDIPDPPPVLWVRGDLRCDDHAVAIVGSRAATPHALDVAFALGEGLARAGVVVVSGLARGVDASAHRGALEAGGRTIAVLGSGVDIVYPDEHRDLAARVIESGALISELVPGTRPVRWHFPRRNRIISGLSAGVVVVEASARSGSLITAARALEQGRAVMAVPGGVLSGRNRGAHGLLRDGARIVEGVDDILEELHYVGAPMVSGAGSERPPHDPVLWAMKVGEPYDVTFLCEQTGVESVRILSRLAELELGGWVTRAGGGRFVRLARTC